MVNLKYAAQVIKNSPGHVHKITGYAEYARRVLAAASTST